MNGIGVLLLAVGAVLLPLSAVIAKRLKLSEVRYALYVLAGSGDVAVSVIGGLLVGDPALGLTISVLSLATCAPVIVALDRRN
jgi:hypothetical protein